MINNREYQLINYDDKNKFGKDGLGYQFGNDERFKSGKPTNKLGDEGWLNYNY